LIFATAAAGSELLAKLRHLHRLATVGTVSAGMAHEIKNALVAIRTSFELLGEGRNEPELIDLARREVERIESVVTGLLRFAGPGKAEARPVRVHPVLDRVLLLAQGRIEGRHISLAREFEAAPDTIPGDEPQLQEAFLNVVLNAIDAMPEGGKLNVATRIRGGDLVVLVADSGLGITAQDFAHLFEPFFTTKRDGTGLGLHITRRVITDHHGSVAVSSEPGQGTTFEFCLPLAIPAEHG
jgi:signal transduction histidine kinase